jgi:hypothetical protein
MAMPCLTIFINEIDFYYNIFDEPKNGSKPWLAQSPPSLLQNLAVLGLPISLVNGISTMLLPDAKVHRNNNKNGAQARNNDNNNKQEKQ